MLTMTLNLGDLAKLLATAPGMNKKRDVGKAIELSMWLLGKLEATEIYK